MPKRDTTKLTGAGQRVFGRLSSDVAREIARSLEAENKHTGMTRAEVARLIGRNRSFVTRKLAGSQNMELRTIAALLGALGYELDVSAHRIDAPPNAMSNLQGRSHLTIRMAEPGQSPAPTIRPNTQNLIMGQSSG